MSKFDNVGICLQKEVDNSATALNSTVYENSRRKSVPGTPGFHSGPSPHASTPSMGNISSGFSPLNPFSHLLLETPTPHQSMNFSAPPPVPSDVSPSGPPPPLSSRPPPKLSSVSGPPPPLSRRSTNISGGA